MNSAVIEKTGSKRNDSIQKNVTNSTVVEKPSSQYHKDNQIQLTTEHSTANNDAEKRQIHHSQYIWLNSVKKVQNETLQYPATDQMKKF